MKPPKKAAQPKDSIWKNIRWFFLRELGLSHSYSDIPDWDEKLAREIEIIRNERAAIKEQNKGAR